MCCSVPRIRRRSLLRSSVCSPEIEMSKLGVPSLLLIACRKTSWSRHCNVPVRELLPRAEVKVHNVLRCLHPYVVHATKDLLVCCPRSRTANIFCRRDRRERAVVARRENCGLVSEGDDLPSNRRGDVRGAVRSRQWIRVVPYVSGWISNRISIRWAHPSDPWGRCFLCVAISFFRLLSFSRGGASRVVASRLCSGLVRLPARFEDGDFEEPHGIRRVVYQTTLVPGGVTGLAGCKSEAKSSERGFEGNHRQEIAWDLDKKCG